MSEPNNKANENLSENSLIDEFVKMGINIENAESKINYSNSSSNKKDLAFNYYFGNNALNQNMQSNANFLNPNFNQMENFLRNNPTNNTEKGANINIDKDPNFLYYFNTRDANNINFTSEEFFKMHNSNLVENNIKNNNNSNNLNNVSQVNPNVPKQNYIGYNNITVNNNNKKNLPNNFVNMGKEDTNYPYSNNNTNNNLNLNPHNFFQGNYVNFNSMFLNSQPGSEQNAFFNQMHNKESNFVNNLCGINKDTVNGFFQNQNPLMKNFIQGNYFDNSNTNSNANFKGNNKGNIFNRNENMNSKNPYENTLVNSFPIMNGFNGALGFNGINNGSNNNTHYFMNSHENAENMSNLNSFTNNHNNRFNSNYNNIHSRVFNNNNNYNKAFNNLINNHKGYENKNNQNQRNYLNKIPLQNEQNEENQAGENRFYDNKNNNNNNIQESNLEQRNPNRRFNKQNFPGNNSNYAYNYNIYHQKNKNNYNKMNDKAETNQSYLLTNPSLLNTQVNSLINLNVMNGTSIKYNIWCSTIKGNQKLQKAFRDADGKFPIYLFFSVNGSGRFLGVAQMTSEIEYRANFNYWSQTEKWKGFFFVKWIYIRDLPNRAFRNLINEFNENKPVTTSRDTQEVSPLEGAAMIKIFNEYAHESSILDDFNFYERKQENVLTKPNAEGLTQNSNKIADRISDKPNAEDNLEQENKADDINNNSFNNFKNNKANFIHSNKYLMNNSSNNNLKNFPNQKSYNNIPMQQISYENSMKHNNFNLNNINNMNLIYNQNNFYNIQNSNNIANKINNVPYFANKDEDQERFGNDEEEIEQNQEPNNAESNQPKHQLVFDPRTLYLLNMNNKNPQFINNPEMLKAFLLGQNNISNVNHNNFQFNNSENNYFNNLTPIEFQSKLNNEENEGLLNLQDENHYHVDSEKSLDENLEKDYDNENYENRD